MAPKGSYIGMLGSHGVALLDMDKEVWFVEGSMSLGSVSKAQAMPNIFLFIICGSGCRTLSYFSDTMSACMLPCSPS